MPKTTTRKDKKKKTGMSTGMLVGLLAGAGILLIVCMATGAGGIYWLRRESRPAGPDGPAAKGSNKPGISDTKTFTDDVQIKAGETMPFWVGGNKGQSMYLTVKPKTDGPQPNLEAWVETAERDEITKRKVKLQSTGTWRGAEFRVEWISSGMVGYEVYVQNKGSASVRCTVTYESRFVPGK